MNKVLMNGTDAIGEAAIQAGCTCYFGYPITPQNELPEYMSRRLPKIPDGIFIQAESELAAINMVLGAAAGGARVMTSSSSPGISLKQEGISFIACQELPAVIVNIVRGGPGLGNIAPSQSDYFQATKGGGHGDYRLIVLAPSNVQELADITFLSFDLADRYRTPVMILGDGMLGQIMEPVIIPTKEKNGSTTYEKDYILQGAKDRPSRLLRSLILDPKELETRNWKLYRKYQSIEKNETRWEGYQLEDAEMVVIAYGTAARIAKGAINRLQKEDKNIKIGMIRPITLWPFPSEAIKNIARNVNDFFVFELSTGQMLEDVKMSLRDDSNIHFYGRPGGVVPTPVELGRIMARYYYQSEKAKNK